MNKIKILTAVSIGLLAVNIILVWFLFSHKPMPLHGGEEEGPRRIVIEKLGFDDSQSKEYDKLIDWHKNEIHKSEEQIKELKNKLYQTLMSDGQETIKDSLITEINTVQSHIEAVHYKHFQDIKRLCKPEQQKAFDMFCLDIAKLFARHPPKHRN